MLIAGLLVLGLAMLYYGAEFLVKGAAALAAALGVPSLVIGLTVVALGTSMPELLVSLSAGWEGKGDIAVGNVVGSNIFNLAAILGLAAVIRPLQVTSQLIRRDVPVMILSALGLVALLLFDGSLGRLDGVILFGAFLLYMAYTVIDALRHPFMRLESDQETISCSRKKTGRDLLLIVVGLVLLAGGAQALVAGAVALAKLFGVSEAVIGLTIIAAGTGLPELATSVMAAVRHEADISVGNIVGSNIFNILCILGACSIITPLQAAGITAVDLWVMAGLSLLMLPLMRTGFRINRAEGALLLIIYGGYLAWLLR